MSSWRDSRTELFLAAGLAVVAAYYFIPTGTPQSIVYDLLAVTASLAIGVAVVLNRPSPALPWILFSLGNVLFAVADVIFNIIEPTGPSVADGFYLTGYPILAAGFVLLLFTTGSQRRFAALGDAAILTFAFMLVQWVFVLDHLADQTGTTMERAVNLAYPIMDIVLLAGLAGFFVTAAWRAPSFLLLVASMLFLLLADEFYAARDYSSSTWLDSSWLLAYLLWAAAALHPSMSELSHPTARSYRQLRVSPLRFGVLTAALLASPLVLLIQHLRGVSVDVPPVVAASVAISVFVVLRLVGILRALEAIRVRERLARAESEQAQRLLEAQNERLREADRLKDEFVALISHDLRTPLTSIMGYVELSLDDDLDVALDDERRGYLEVVARSSQRLLRLVDDLLFVARLQSGRLELNATRLDLNEVARQAAEEAGGRADAKELELVVNVNGPVPIDADRGRMFQLFDNLISNAIKFTPDRGRVEIRVGREEDAVLEVSDTGIGFTRAEAARVFERFYRTENALAHQVPGTGLGLFIAHAITDAHGGRISAHPREGGGAVFRVELPLAE